MTNRQTRIQAKHPDGRELQLSETTSDSPILPVAQLGELQKIDPSLVQWVVTQTQAEAEFRRSETNRVNRYIFIERLAGLLSGALVAIVGLLIAAYTAVKGHDWVAAAIGGATLVAIVTVLVVRKPQSDIPKEDSTPPKTSNARKK